MTTPPASEPDHTVRLGKPEDDAPAPVVALGPVRPSKPAASEETVRLGGPDAGPNETVQLGGWVVGPNETVQLRIEPEAVALDEELTVRLSQDESAGTVRLGPPPAGSTVQLRLPAEALGFESATFLDPEVWPAPTAVDRTRPDAPAVAPAEPGAPVEPAAPVAPEPDGLRRFGPGVPPQAAAVWHGTAEPPRKRRWRRWLILPLLLAMLAALGYWAWQQYGRPMVVNSVAVQADPAPLTCDGTQVVRATLATDGGGGDVRYRWRRSDGTDSGELVQHIPRGRRATELVLRWSFHGQGSMDATATLELLAPEPHTGAVSFTYDCA
ncbi:hypothetical protein KCMC57_up03870 [Kitasatospora sp. CMC57]|uniref:Ig-like domain-containing protein n=1 Tax=Kitasatospora sp. CMC57 TaxID=3231513 RepID=A0AB33JTV5_9ACTN